MKLKEDLLKTIKHYGVRNQLKHLHTEVYELDEAVLDYENNKWRMYPSIGENYIKNIAGELADIINFVEEIQLYYGIPKKTIKEIRKQKMQRQLKRIEFEKLNRGE